MFNAPPYLLCDAKLVSAVELIRGCHDAIATSALRGVAEVVCHGGLGPHNTVFRGDTAAAEHDWGEDLAPGSRLTDFAHAVWCSADLIEPDVPVQEQAGKTRLVCATYPGMTPRGVGHRTARPVRPRSPRARVSGRAATVEVIDDLITWLDTNGERITGT